jgi:hypothetical protein
MKIFEVTYSNGSTEIVFANNKAQVWKKYGHIAISIFQVEVR